MSEVSDKILTENPKKYGNVVFVKKEKVKLDLHGPALDLWS